MSTHAVATDAGAGSRSGLSNTVAASVQTTSRTTNETTAIAIQARRGMAVRGVRYLSPSDLSGTTGGATLAATCSDTD